MLMMYLMQYCYVSRSMTQIMFEHDFANDVRLGPVTQIVASYANNAILGLHMRILLTLLLSE